MSFPAPTLPSGYARSAWPDLEPSARSHLLNYVLSTRVDLEPAGQVDYYSAAEPLLRLKNTQTLVSIAGEVIRTGGLEIAITEGQVSRPSMLVPLALVIVAATVTGAIV